MVDKTVVTLYGKPNCAQCLWTKTFLVNNNIPHKIVNLLEDAESLAKFKAMGFVQAPIVETADDVWSGFNQEKLNALKKE